MQFIYEGIYANILYIIDYSARSALISTRRDDLKIWR